MGATKPQGRIIWIDVARGVSISLVVYYHMILGFGKVGLVPDGSALAYLSEMVRSFRMPMFFMVSGILFMMFIRRVDGVRVAHRILNILYLYLVWSIVRVVTRFAFGAFANTPGSLEEILWILVDPQPEMWFLYVLALLTLTAYVTRGGNPWLLVVVACGLSIVSDYVSNEVVYKYCYYLPYFILGFRLSDMLREQAEAARPIAAIARLVAFVGLFVVTEALEVQRLAPVALLLGLIGGWAMLPLCVALGASRVGPALAYVGRYSLMVYALSFLFVAGSRAVMLHLGIKTTWLLVPLIWTIGVVGPLIAYEIARRVGLQVLFAIPDRAFAWMVPGAPAAAPGKPRREAASEPVVPVGTLPPPAAPLRATSL